MPWWGWLIAFGIVVFGVLPVVVGAAAWRGMSRGIFGRTSHVRDDGDIYIPYGADHFDHLHLK
jgi:hypothetical protein